MILIPCNKPYLIEVNEVGQIGSKIELFIWNGATEPSTPTYTFTKDAPSSTDLANYYNISPFIAEYIDLSELSSSIYSNSELQENLYANVRVKRYKNVAGTYTLLDSTKYISTYGIEWGDTDRVGFLTNPTPLYYNFIAQTAIFTNINFKKVRIRNYETNEILFEDTFSANKLIGIIIDFGLSVKVELLGLFDNVFDSRIFLYQTECLYTPISILYANSFGIIEITDFYKANKKEFSIENSEFKKFQTVESNFYVGKQRQTFNTLGREKITVNSGWVSESYSQVIKDILMSEFINIYQNGIINELTPVNIDTKSIEIQQNINNGLINYQLSFTYSNDYRR